LLELFAFQANPQWHVFRARSLMFLRLLQFCQKI